MPIDVPDFTIGQESTLYGDFGPQHRNTKALVCFIGPGCYLLASM